MHELDVLKAIVIKYEVLKLQVAAAKTRAVPMQAFGMTVAEKDVALRVTHMSESDIESGRAVGTVIAFHGGIGCVIFVEAGIGALGPIGHTLLKGRPVLAITGACALNQPDIGIGGPGDAFVA